MPWAAWCCSFSPMSYLDYSKFQAFLARYFSERAAGPTRDSGYFDIIRFFGRDAVDPRDIAVRCVPGRYRFSDTRIARFADEIATELRRQGRLLDGPTVMKLVSFDPSARPPIMAVQEAAYEQSSGSCFALDVEHPLFADAGGTLREYYKPQCRSHAVTDNPLCICLGVSGMLLTAGARGPLVLQVKRTGKVATLAGEYGPSVAGVVDFTDRFENLEQLLRAQMAAEISEELNLRPDEYTLEPLAYAREIFRGERPQLFSLIRTTLDASGLARRLNGTEPSRREFDSFDLVAAEALPPARLNFEAKMNWHFVSEYLDTL